MKRRSFLRRALPATLLPFAIDGLAARAWARHPLLTRLLESAATDRVFVLIQLSGGNDGLNMVIPLDQHAAYANARTNIAIPEAAALPLAAGTGLHPAMTGLASLYADGKLAVVQAVGYPNPNFSHFRATDIWLTGADYNQTLTTGWMGRTLEEEFPGFPDGYPNATMPDPPAIQIGSVISPGLQGSTIAMGMAITNPTSFYNLVNNTTEPTPDTPAGHELRYIRIVAEQTNLYADAVKAAANNASNLSTLYPASGNTLADQLKIVARLVAGGLKTRIYVVGLGGFDTHANQTDAADTTTGNHATLLGKLSVAVTAFQDDLRLLGVEDRVAGMTYSEFGRRIRSNASRGTDHGAAAPLFVFGSRVRGGIIGVNPTIPATPTTSDNIPMQHDFRNVYASLLRDWFGLEDAVVRALLLTPRFTDIGILPIIRTQPPVAAEPVAAAAAPMLSQHFPNPVAAEGAVIPFTSDGGHVRVSVHDARGREVATLVDAYMASGAHRVRFTPAGLPAGTYYVRMQRGPYERVLPMTVAR